MPGIKIQNGDIAPFVIKQINSDRYVGSVRSFQIKG